MKTQIKKALNEIKGTLLLSITKRDYFDYMKKYINKVFTIEEEITKSNIKFNINNLGLVEVWKPSKNDILNIEHCHYLPKAKMICFINSYCFNSIKWAFDEQVIQYERDKGRLLVSLENEKQIEAFFKALEKEAKA